MTKEQHIRLIQAFMAIALFHLAEHIIQMVQVHGLHMERTDAGGILGMFNMWLMRSEWLHFVYAVVMEVSMILLLPWFYGKSYQWWYTAIIIQLWHCFEHTLLLVQAQTGQYLFGSKVPTSIIQLVMPKVELHFSYNLMVMIPIMIALIVYRYKPVFR